MDEYQRKIRKGSRVSDLDHSPLLGTVEAVYLTVRDGHDTRYAPITWDDGTRGGNNTANLILARDVIEGCPDCMTEGYDASEARLKMTLACDTADGRLEYARCGMCRVKFVRYGRGDEWATALDR